MAAQFYMFIKAENLLCKFTGVTEEHVAKILQFIIILFAHKILSACRSLKLH